MKVSKSFFSKESPGSKKINLTFNSNLPYHFVLQLILISKFRLRFILFCFEKKKGNIYKKTSNATKLQNAKKYLRSNKTE